jgi:NADH dehydrogenase
MNDVLYRERDVVATDRDDPHAAMAAPPPDENPSQILHRIVVVGGGVAGLELVRKFGDRVGRRRRASVTLVERARTHLWKPLPHAVAAGSLDPGECEVNYLAQAHWHGFRYCFGEIIGLDRAAKEVHLAPTFDEEGRQITAHRSIDYDTLVIAIGSVTNDFGTPGWPNMPCRWKRRLRPSDSTAV